MTSKENIIVSLTSWYKRINNTVPVLGSLLHQTLPASKIILNLCTEDFPNMEKDLPKELLELVAANPKIEIYWFLENYKAFKKHLHAVEIATDDDLILSADDDHIYPSDFIEKMYVSYCYYDKKFPVTLNKIMLSHGLWTFNGPGTLYRKKDWGPDYQKYLTYNVLRNCNDDIFLTILFAINKVIILPEIFHFIEDKKMLYNDNDAWTDRKSAKRHKVTTEKIDSLFETTLAAIDESFKETYFHGRKSVFTPDFWEIIENAVIYNLERYENSKWSGLNFMFDNFFKNYLRGNYYNLDFKAIGLDVPRPHFRKDFVGDNKLIVTISSWPKRIENVGAVLESILENTILPDEIVLNLAKQDFGFDKDKEVSFEDFCTLREQYKIDDLIDLIQTSGIIKIHWYDDPELKSWKKHLYVLDAYDKNDLVICIDDDILYSPVFIEVFLKSYNYYGREFPITSITASWCHGTFGFCGHSTLYRIGDFGDYKKYISEKLTHMLPEDNHLLNLLLLNGKLLMPVIGRNFLFKNTKFNQGDSNFGNNVFTEEWWNSYRKLIDESTNIIKTAAADREELKIGWSPWFYNFAWAETEKFVKNYKNKWTTGYKKIVFDAIEKHFNGDFGREKETCIDDALCNIII